MRNVLINVHSCINMTYLKMLFYEPIYESQMLAYEVNAIEEIDSLKESLRKDLDRISFGDKNCRLMLCVARKAGKQNVPEYTDLYYMIHAWGFAAQFDGLFSKTEVFVIDMNRNRTEICDKEINENGRVLEDGYVLTENSVLPYPSLWKTGSPREFAASVCDYKETVSNPFCKMHLDQVSRKIVITVNDMNNSLLAQENELSDTYARCYKTWRESQSFFPKLLRVPVYEDEPAAGIMSYLQLAFFISDPNRTDLSQQEYDESCEKYEPALVSHLLYQYKNRFERAKDNTAENPLHLIINSRTNTSKIKELEMETKSIQAALPKLVESDAYKKLTREKIDEWIQGTCVEVENAENHLEKFSDDLVDRYFDQDSEIRIETIVEIDKKEDELCKKRSVVLDNYAKYLNAKTGLQFKDRTDICNYIKHAGSNIKYWSECLKICSLKLFITAWLASMLAILIPYIWIQPYIFSKFNGIATAVIFVAITAGLFYLTYKSAHRVIIRSIRRETRDISTQTGLYFNDYIQRARNFQDLLHTGIDGLSEIDSELEQIQKWKKENGLLEKEKRWHRARIMETLRMLDHFEPLIPILDIVPEGPKAAAQIDFSKDDIGNRFYWLDREVTEADMEGNEYAD